MFLRVILRGLINTGPGLYGGVAKLNPLLSEDTRKHTWNLQKKKLNDPQTLRNKILLCDEPQFKASCLKETSSAHHLQSTIPKVKCAGSSLMPWGCFSAAGTEGLIIVEKLNAPKYRNSLNENPVQSIQNLRLAEGLPSNRTMTLSTQGVATEK